MTKTGIEATLKQAGLRLTKPRLLVWQYLQTVHQPVSAKTCHQKLADLDLVSVYRALHLLAKLHLIQTETVDNEQHYCLAAVPHHHLICRVCGKTVAVPCRHSFAHFKGFHNIEHALTLSGLCDSCHQKYEN